MARKTALEELPPTLNRTYDRILEKRCGNTLSREIVRRTLHWICYDKAFSIRSLRQALTESLVRDRVIPINNELIGEDEIGRYCSSLIRKGQNGLCFEIAHFTVEEYLRTGIPPGSELASFRYSSSETSQSMTTFSLWYILRPMFGYQPFANEEYEKTIRARTTQYPFYVYASTFWPAQTGCHDDPDVGELLKVLFGPKSRAQFHNWLIQSLLHGSKLPELDDFSDASVQDLTKLAIHQDITPLHVAASLGISALCDWLLQPEACSTATEAVSISLLDCTFIGHNTFHLYTGLRIRDLVPAAPTSTMSTLRQLQTADRNRRNGIKLQKTLNIFQQKTAIGSYLEKGMTGPLAINASVLYQEGTIFSLLLDESPEDYLTRDTIEAIRFYFKHGETQTGSALHHIIQRVLNLATSTDSNSSVGEAIKLTQEMVQLGGEWGRYNHFQNEFISAHIENDKFGDFLRVAAAQNRVAEVSHLLQDARFDPKSETAHDILRESVTSDRVDIVETLLKHHSMSLYETNRPESIWHTAARENATRVIQLLLQDASAIETNLQRVSTDGCTPFSEAVLNGSLQASKLLLNHCGDDPVFFQCEPPVLHISVAKNWPHLFYTLLEKCAVKSVEDRLGRTPLFFVETYTEIQFVQELGVLYSPDHQDKNGRVAFQHFVQMLLGSDMELELDADHILSMFKALAPSNWRVSVSENPEQHMWEYFCQCLRNRGRAAISPAQFYSLTIYIGRLCEVGVVDSYEEHAKLSALVPLFEALESLDLNAGEYRWEQQCVAEAMDLFRQRTNHLEFQNSDSAMIALLEKAVQQDHYGLVSFLTENGTPTHRTGNESSPLIKACASGSVRTFSRILRFTPSSALEDTADVQPDILCRLILTAVNNNKRTAIRKLLISLRHGLSPDAVTTGGDYRGFPAITIAARFKLFEIVDLMLEWSADPLACDSMGWNVTTYYVCFNEVKRLRDLIKNLRSQSTEIEWSSAVTCTILDRREKGTALHFAKSGEMVDFIIKTTSMIGVKSTSSSQMTPLHVASSTGSTDAIKALIKHGAIIDAVTSDGKRPLDLASKHGHADAVRILLELGAVRCSDINARVNINGETSLILAVRNSGDECRYVQSLLDDGADTSLRDIDGWSAIMLAARHDFIQVAKLLVEAGASIHTVTVFGDNILHISADNGSTRCFAYFLQLGCDAHLENIYGNTALYLAGSYNSLISYCAKSNAIYGATRRVKQQLLTDAISERSCGTVLQVICSLPKGEVPLLTSTRRYHWCSVLCQAVAEGCKRCINTLLTHGADIEMEGSNQGTPLMQACAFGQLSMVKLLVRNNAKLDYFDEHGVHRNAFDEALEWPDIIQWLLVGRFQDQVKLCMEAHNPEAEVVPWMGPRHFEYHWERNHDMRSDGSQIDHLKLMTKIKAVVRGEVVEGRLSVNISEESEGQRRL